jgi:hypothetical protein
MRREIAQYIISLDQAANKTHQSEDRQIYQIILADSAVLLALVDTGANKELIIEAATRHDRLWGQMWPVDNVCAEAISEWQTVRRLIY